METGVPQGSILGPLLFVLFINDLPQTVTNCTTLMYADDTVLYYSAKTVSEIEHTINSEFESISTWIRNNSLFLHHGKTECVLFGTPSKLANISTFTISLDGNPIKQVSEFTYLGVIMNKSLSWTSHISYISERAAKRSGMLRRIRNNISANTANVVYKSFILPIMDYCDVVWDNCGKINSTQLEKLQRKAVRLIMKTTSSDVALANLAYDTLEHRRELHILKLVRKCISNRSTQLLNNYFMYNRDIKSRITRQSNLLYLPKVRLESTKKAFYYHGSVIFNNNAT